MDEVISHVPKDLLRQLVAGARECAEDLIAEADAKWPQTLRDEQPAASRRYIRDVATALATLDLVVRLETDHLAR